MPLNMKSILVIAPHPDDETLGCGGVLLRARSEGIAVHWLIVTAIDPKLHPEQSAARECEIEAVAADIGFATITRLDYPTTALDQTPIRNLVEALGKIIRKTVPDTMLVPFANDSHSDHRIVHQAAMSCTKWFRYPTLRRICSYETLSETDASLSARNYFCPNLFIDISPWLDGKVRLMRHYNSEMGQFPFPRSEEAIRAQAAVRGVASGCAAAEAFMILREIVP